MKRKTKIGLIILLVALVAVTAFILISKVPIFKETLYITESEFGTVQDYYSQGELLKLRVDSTTWNAVCKKGLIINKVALPTLDLYDRVNGIYIGTITGTPFEFEGNTRVRETIYWRVPNDFDSGKYKIIEQVWCYKSPKFDSSGDLIDASDAVEVSQETTTYFAVSRLPPCDGISDDEECRANKAYRECSAGDSYTGFAWSYWKKVVGKCGIECLSSSDCGSGYKCNENYKCESICVPKWTGHLYCTSNSVYMEMSCDADDLPYKACSSNEECINGYCRIKPPPPPPCPELGSKPCSDAFVAKRDGCDMWDNSLCDDCPELSSKPCDEAFVTKKDGCDVWDISLCEDPDPDCNEGEITTKTCQDSSVITISMCIDGNMVDTDAVCLAPPECFKDTDCSESEVCSDDGVCVAGGGGRTCWSDSDCYIDYDSCLEGYCKLGECFTRIVDSPECKEVKSNFWIIIASVLGGLIFILLIVLVVVLKKRNQK